METTKDLQITQNGLRGHGIGMIAMLIVQYILGMVSNLFVQFPQSEQDGKLWEFAWSQISIASHIILGILLFIGAVVFVIRAVAKKDRFWTIASIIGLVAIMSAIYGGVSFIPSQVDQFSLIMSIGFLVALLAYSWGLYATKK